MTGLICDPQSLCSGSSPTSCNEDFGNAFVGRKDINFINCLNSELLKNVVGQNLLYYRVDEERTQQNIYGESKRKLFLNPIKIFARVELHEPTQKFDQFSLDEESKVTVYFDKYDLYKNNIKPTVGDFIKFSTIVYEILTLWEWQPIYGIARESLLVKAECRSARDGQLDELLQEDDWK